MCPLFILGILGLAVLPLHAAEPIVEKGNFRFTPTGDQANVPERYRLSERTFDYQMRLLRELPNSGVRVFRVQFPSPVKSATPENNAVHAEYYLPSGKGPFPGVIVLDITAGNQNLSRYLSLFLAQKKIAALFVQMAYYGPRRPPGSKLRLLMPNIEHSLGAIRQTVLDLRVAAAWLEARPEIDGKRLGIMGTSLGSFMAALTAEMEPKLGRVAVLLGGGGVVDAYYNHPQAASYRRVYEALGGTKEKLAQLIAPADPLTCAANLRQHKLLILAGKRDDIVPPKMAEALWKASGQQKIVWYDCTHYGAIVYLAAALDQIVKHFQTE
ncbi:MAG TPA: prolyl oligopeptidase family serine peptidase [Gemmataceae bacterium]|nr:prolyl oligopeptidase family serine peptidase [Gemmataceae bacterium]